jgi:hypothetical protein
MSSIVTNVGLQIIANRIKGLLTEPLKIGWGTGTTEPTISDTTLEAEDTDGGYARVSGVSSIVTVGTTEDTYQVSGAITSTVAQTITEWALFDNAGNMLCREVAVPGYTLAIGGLLNFIFKIQISRLT